MSSTHKTKNKTTCHLKAVVIRGNGQGHAAAPYGMYRMRQPIATLKTELQDVNTGCWAKQYRTVQLQWLHHATDSSTSPLKTYSRTKRIPKALKILDI